MKKLFQHTKRPEQKWEGIDESEYDWDSVSEEAEEEYYEGADEEDYPYETGDEEYYENSEAEGEEYYGTEGTEYTGEIEYAEDGAYYGDTEAEGESVEGEEYYGTEGTEYTGEIEYAEDGAYYGDTGAEGESVEGEEYYGAEEAEYTGEVEYAEDGAYYGDTGAEGESVEGEEYYGAEEAEYTGEVEYAEDGAYYGDTGAEGESIDGEEYYGAEEAEYAEDGAYDGDIEEAEKKHAGRNQGAKLKKKKTSLIDHIIALTGVAVLVLAIATGVVFVSSKMIEGQVSDFVNVGTQLADISTIGGSGLVAVADAQLARIQAASQVQEDAEKEQKDYQEEAYERNVTVSMSMTSIQKDLKIKFINKKTDKLVANVPFAVNVTDPDGKTSIWSDDDMDGIIYKKDITPGTYKVAMEALTDTKYQDYSISTDTKSVEVKKDIAYQKVDVANEVKKESEVNAKKEDTKKNETKVESSLTDTVAWVESKIIEATYSEVAKSSVPSPLTLVLNKNFMRMSAVGTVTGNDPTPTPVPTLTPSPTPVVGTISFDKASVSLLAGQTTTVTAAVAGFDVISWNIVSANTAVATVAANGNVITVAGAGVGTTNIIVAAAGANNATASASFAVTVGANKTIALDKTATVVFMGEPVVINAAIANAVSAETPVEAESSDTGIATVSVNKKAVTITGVAAGSCTVTVKYTENGETVTAACTVTVKNHPRDDTTTRLKDGSGNLLYINDNGTYREATYADYFKYDTFYLKGAAKYAGWQTLDGKVYYFTADGNKVTGEQVIQGAKYNFASDGSLVKGSGNMGIDVSKWNGTIDWTAVKNSGIDYAIIRCGYRGSSQGSLIEDPKFAANIKGATAAGLKVGVYFFTQAVDEREAVEEASMVLNQVKSYTISYPIFLDVEPSGGRGDSISKETRTAVCKAFCQTIQNAGYTAGIYANKTWLESKLDAGSLSAYKIWLAQYAATPTYTGRYDLWQYRSTGNVTGISGGVDMNISYLGY